MPTGYVLIFYWTIVAIGGALFLGTGAALVRYRRTGAFPGQEATGHGHEPTAGETRRVAVRCTLGLALVLVGGVGLITA